MAPLPMFPLGTVLLPGVGLPLHVFEPRYRALVEDCMAGEREFGVVLIERGSEVGGGEVRSDVGTVATILEAVPFDDGRWALVTGGTRRIRVTEWLTDDPYPRAEVEDWPEPEAADPDATRSAVAAVTAKVRRLLAAQAELGAAAAPATVELADDPALALHQVAAVSGLGPLDAQQVLSADSIKERVLLVDRFVDEALETAAAALRMSDGGEGPGDP
ncbi:MAG: LON peptidase substrate-binding domain-containing protein [Acidimicrobiia bacterium]|nr:LON peptidase substrate-binding domain-containing protein [Acidimicrobiia bacterium]